MFNMVRTSTVGTLLVALVSLIGPDPAAGQGERSPGASASRTALSEERKAIRATWQSQLRGDANLRALLNAALARPDAGGHLWAKRVGQLCGIRAEEKDAARYSSGSNVNDAFFHEHQQAAERIDSACGQLTPEEVSFNGVAKKYSLGMQQDLVLENYNALMATRRDVRAVREPLLGKAVEDFDARLIYGMLPLDTRGGVWFDGKLYDSKSVLDENSWTRANLAALMLECQFGAPCSERQDIEVVFRCANDVKYCAARNRLELIEILVRDELPNSLQSKTIALQIESLALKMAAAIKGKRVEAFLKREF